VAITWGDWEDSGGNGMRVGIEVIWDTPTHSSTVLDVDVLVYTQNRFTYSDDQKLTYGGSISGSTSFTNNHDDTAFQRDNVDYNYTYPSTSYGTSPGSKTFSASLSGAYNGITPSVSVSSPIPIRPYAAPAAPTSVALTRASDTSIIANWVNHATAGEPYVNQGIQRSINGAAFTTLSLTVSGSATSYNDTTVTSNKKYRYQVRSQNTIGNSSFVQSGDIWTSPTAPTGVTRTGLNGANQTVAWTNTAGYPVNTEWQTEVWRSIDNAAYALLTTVAGSAVNYVDTYPATHPTNKFKYIVRHKTTAGTILYSAWSNETTQTTGTTTPPLASTNLSPNGVVVDPTLANIMTWTFNLGQVGDTQVFYLVRHRLTGASAWTTIGPTASATSQYIMPANTYSDGSIVEWQVQTMGADPTPSPWSASATYTNTITVITPPPIIYPADIDVRSGQVRANSAFNEIRDYLTRTVSQLFGGGTRTVDASYNVNWSTRFIAIAFGNSINTAAVGFFNINPPFSNAVTNKALSSNVATLTVSGSHRFRVGETVIVSGVDATFNGTFVLRQVTTTTISYDKTATNVTSVASGGSVGHRLQGHGGASDQVASSAGYIPLSATWTALYYELPFSWGAGTTPRKNGVVTVTNKVLTTNVATLTVLSPHYIALGDAINVAIGDAAFDGQYTVTGVTASTITYARTNANVTSAAASGYVKPFGSDTLMGNYHLVNYTVGFVVPSNWIFIAMRNGDTNLMEWVTGDAVPAGSQGPDPTITALAAYNTNGLLVQTAANTFVGRNIAGDGTMATVINPAGTAGDPTLGVANSGAVTAGFTAATNWAINTASYRIVAGLIVVLHLQLTYSGTTITGPADGNIGNTAIVSVVPAAARPNRDLRCLFAVGSASCGSAAVTAAGTVQIESLMPTYALASGQQVTVDFVYALAS
jgi:hypothetical protein